MSQEKGKIVKSSEKQQQRGGEPKCGSIQLVFSQLLRLSNGAQLNCRQDLMTQSAAEIQLFAKNITKL
jgi:hypothetical protein